MTFGYLSTRSLWFYAGKIESLYSCMEAVLQTLLWWSRRSRHLWESLGHHLIVCKTILQTRDINPALWHDDILNIYGQKSSKTWICKAGKCTISSFLVWYGNRLDNGMSEGNDMHFSSAYCNTRLKRWKLFIFNPGCSYHILLKSQSPTKHRTQENS